jgi:hypothetical protein
MVTGNRGELGKNAIPQSTRNKINQLSSQEDRIYKRYESLANNIINRLGRQMKETGTITVGQTTQQLANVFRAGTIGSTKSNRQQTNTYIPSFQLPQNLIAQAQNYVPDKYAGLITAEGRVQIYVAAMTDLMPQFQEAAADFGILYQPNAVKDTLTTKQDSTQFKKRNANGVTDGGKYAGTEAIIAKAAGKGCQAACFECNTGNGNKAPLLRDSDGTCVTANSAAGNCANCAQLFTNAPAPALGASALSAELAAGGDLPEIGTQAIEDYPDEDGTERIGRPPSPSTTTRKIYYAPPGWSPSNEGGATGVVGGARRLAWDIGLSMMIILLIMLRA